MADHVAVIRVTDENREALARLALSMYLGEACKFCGRVFETLDDLHDAVYAGYHARGRVACKSCWDNAQPPASEPGGGGGEE